jgi:hypothetical protein
MMKQMTRVPPESVARQDRLLEPLQAVMRQVAANADLAEVLALATKEIHQHMGYEIGRAHV